MSGKLYLVGTPIGNLGDISPRALRTLESADFIAAEDTRVTLRLLNHFNIKKPLVSYYEHNSKRSGERILERLLAGESCALVTDAGMPSVSDPGEELAARCAAAGVEISAVPGPSAAVTALALSALPSGRFTFEGFLSTSGKSRREHLESLRGERRTMIFYEAPHKLVRTLADLRDAFGVDEQGFAAEVEVERHIRAFPGFGDFAADVEPAAIEFFAPAIADFGRVVGQGQPFLKRNRFLCDGDFRGERHALQNDFVGQAPVGFGNELGGCHRGVFHFFRPLVNRFCY